MTISITFPCKAKLCRPDTIIMHLMKKVRELKLAEKEKQKLLELESEKSVARSVKAVEMEVVDSVLPSITIRDDDPFIGRISRNLESQTTDFK